MSEKSSSSKLSSFIKGSSILVLSNICLKAINFFLLPLYTGYLTSSQLGVSDSITNLTGILLPLLTMGMDSSFSAFYFDKDDPDRSKKVFHTLCSFFFFVGLVPLFLILFSVPLSELLFNNSDYGYIVVFGLVSVSFNLWYSPYALELRLKNKMFLFGLSNLISSVSMIILNIIFVSVLHLGASSLVLSLCIVHIESYVIFIFMVGEKPSKKYVDKSLMKPMLKFALPLLPMSLMMWLLSISDRFVLLHYFGEDVVGVYGIGLRFASLLSVVTSAVAVAYTTFVYSSKDDDNAKTMYYYIFNVMFLVLIGASFTVSVFGKEIVYAMTSSAEYYDAYRTLRDLMFAQTFYALTTIVGYGILFKKKSIYALISVSAGAILNILLNFILIPKYGMVAAAFTTLLGYMLHFFISLVFSKKLYPCNYGEVKVISIMFLLYWICFFLERMSLPIKICGWTASAALTIFVFRDIISTVINFAKTKLNFGKQKNKDTIEEIQNIDDSAKQVVDGEG